jgi:hypothetical protein
MICYLSPGKRLSISVGFGDKILPWTGTKLWLTIEDFSTVVPFQEYFQQYLRLFDFDAYRYHPSAGPCPQAFLTYTEPWWIIDLAFKFFWKLTFWVYLHWWKPSKRLHYQVA